MTFAFWVPSNAEASHGPAPASTCSTFSCSEDQPWLEMSVVLVSRKARLYVWVFGSPVRSTVKKFVSAGTEPQRPSQSTVSGEPAVTTPDSAGLCVAGADGATIGDAPVVPVAPPTEAKPVAHTAPVARPTAPNASQAVSPRRRDFVGLCEFICGCCLSVRAGPIRPRGRVVPVIGNLRRLLSRKLRAVFTAARR